MHGVVFLLDKAHYAATEQLWAELAEVCGLRGVYVTPYPHFSYHVAQGYTAVELATALQRLTNQAQAFTVTTAGLGVFTGPAPVLYLPVVRTLALSQFHQQVWECLEPLSTGSVSYYQPQAWVPHITLSFGEVPLAKLAAAMQLLGGRTFNWEITVNHLAYMADTGTEQVLLGRYAFGA